MQRGFGPWAFAGLVLIVSYAVVQTWTPQYSNMYLFLVLLAIVIAYFGGKSTGTRHQEWEPPFPKSTAQDSTGPYPWHIFQ